MKKYFNLLNTKQIITLYEQATGETLSNAALQVYIQRGAIGDKYHLINGVSFFDEKAVIEWINKQKAAINAKKQRKDGETKSGNTKTPQSNETQSGSLKGGIE